MFSVIISFLLLGVIIFGLWYFERMLAHKPNRGPGLIMPVSFLIISVIAMFQSIPAVFADMEAVGGVSGAIMTLVLSFLLSNAATVWVYIIYFRTRRKMGERPWPLRSKPNKH